MAKRCALVLHKPGLDRPGRDKLAVALGRLRAHGVNALSCQPDTPDVMASCIAEYAATTDRIIVAGGDGSVNHAAPALIDSGLPVGILPLGTANDLARTLTIPEDMAAAGDIIGRGHTQRIDVGQVDSRYFFNVAHVGLAARVALQADGRTKKYLGPLAYFVEAWQAFRAQRSFGAEIRCDGESLKDTLVQISVGNGPYYGGGTPIAEDAAIDDARLDLYALPALGSARLMALVPLLRAGRTRATPDIITRQGSDMEVRTDKPRTITADGEVIGETPARFRVLSGALRVYTPA